MTDQNPATSLNLVVDDLRAEGDDLFSTLADMDTGYWTQHSTFKNWTLWDVVAHLHFSDHMAMTTLNSAAAFKKLLAEITAAGSGRAYTNRWLRPADAVEATHAINGPELLQRWRDLFLQLCDALRAADPEARFAWAGPGMKARMFATARQMETWAHGWEIYDLMDKPRRHTDRIKNIATIGVRTFGWTFTNRKLPIPQPPPYVRLSAPSGAIWEWHNAESEHCVKGDAVEFCQVVTQVRNIADTGLEVSGDHAVAWMASAQCFAGPPEDPPAPGSRGPLAQ